MHAAVLTETEKADLVPTLLYGAKTGEWSGMVRCWLTMYMLTEIVRGSLGMSRAMVEECVEMMEAHDLHPVVAEVFEWQDAPKAFEALLKQSAVGKIVIKV
jgi:NADPH:quinone reductase-like Zn-dependent oxidoreductase